MSEDDVYNRLKGLSVDEVRIIVRKAFDEINAETGIGVTHVTIRNRVDPLLKPYGWSYDRFYDHCTDIIPRE